MAPCSPGRITYYDYNAEAACSFGDYGGPTLDYVYLAAANTAFFDNATICGECYELTGPSGSVVLMIADLCPAGSNNIPCLGDMDHFDTTAATGSSSDTFAMLADPSYGEVLVTKRKVACSHTQNVGVYTKDGVSATWMALLVYNHNVGITRLQIQPTSSSGYYDMVRQSYNYWIYADVAIVVPYNIIITGETGETINMTLTDFESSKAWLSDKQFADPATGYGGSSSGDAPCPAPLPSTIVYDDSLYTAKASSSSWTDASWGLSGGSKPNYQYSTDPHSGQYCIQLMLTNYGGLQLLRDMGFDWSGLFSYFTFWGRSDSDFDSITVRIGSGGGQSFSLTSSWQLFNFSLDSTGLDAPAVIGGADGPIIMQIGISGTTPNLYFDDIYFGPTPSGDDDSGSSSSNTAGSTTNGKSNINSGSSLQSCVAVWASALLVFVSYLFYL